MSDPLAAAQAALQAGRAAEAVEHLIAAIQENPARPAQVYHTLGVQLYKLQRHADGAEYVGRGLERYPKAFDLLNLQGVLLRRSGRPDAAAEVLRRALKLEPKSLSAMSNLANVLLEVGDNRGAEQVLEKLVRLEPRNSEHRRLLGRALQRQVRFDEAISRFRQAATIGPKNREAWLDLLGILLELRRFDDAAVVFDNAEAQLPTEIAFREGRVILLRRQGKQDAAEQALKAALAADPDQAWAHNQLGQHIGDLDRPLADEHLRRAFELEPSNLEYRFTYAESLNRKREGGESANVERAYQLIRDVPGLGALNTRNKKIATEIFVRMADFDRLRQLGSVGVLALDLAGAGMHAGFLNLLGRVETDEDRLALLAGHRAWGDRVAAGADVERTARRRPRAPRSKMRLGFMSSDLRMHPVGYFAQPLFDHVDRERFDVFVYSYCDKPEDDLQRQIASNISAYNVWPEITAEEAAGRIAEDSIDLLLELGGSTHMNRIEVMAWRPAPKQGSWLGYPHSAGLTSIDYLVCDPYCMPPRRELLIEAPLLMPKTWIALGRMVFGDTHAIDDGVPEDRTGLITFGTANNPHKYNPVMFDHWTAVMNAVPGSRFAFVRPEGDSPSFRANILAQFARGGIAADRIDFHTIRGKHMPYYNLIDISLDTLPLTGGTTTTESLWMGVPVVSLVGDAFFERLSYSILSNAGLGDLCAATKDEYVRIAVQLAGDRARRTELRRSLRDTLRAGPLGQTEAFARDFYDMVAREVGGPIL